jgi:Predicted metal-dependent hydrolase of the TIM-barrel fold
VNRRKFLLSSGVLSLAAIATAGWKYWPEQGFSNPCRAELPPHLNNHELIKTAWEGLDPAQVWDCHVHLVGRGDGGSGIWVNPAMDSLWNPIQYAQKLFFLNAGCAHQAPGRVDQSYIERMHNLVDGMSQGVKLLLFAFDRFHDETGKVDWERTSFYTPDAYAAEMARVHSRYFEWAASIHPYRGDCVEALQHALSQGTRAVKWLPAAMGMDPASPLCDRFYAALARFDVPLITHAGMERAVSGGNTQHYGNPLRLRRALDHGVRVVVAHCASLGQDQDVDRGANGPWRNSFELFARLMDEPKYQGRLYGDISALTQINRADYLKPVLERNEWHDRLLNGSDYPLPGVMPLFSVDLMVELHLLDAAAAPVLKEIREHNPLLFDFVLKRHLRAGSKRLAVHVFETRRFFEREKA